MSVKRAQVFYSGRVQGVGFRMATREVANGFKVTGHVKNLVDGRVEVIAEGEEGEVKMFLRAVGASEVGPMIQNETVNWQGATGEFERFTVVM